MRYRLLLFVSFALLLTACSGLKEQTLGNMARPAVVIDVDTPVVVERNDAIKYYRSTMEQDIDNRYRARAMKRLADLELEVGVDKEVSANEPLKAADIEEYRLSIGIYKELLKSYPDFPGNDQVLYQLAQAYERLTMVDESGAALTQLVTTYPDSPLYVEAQFRRGEILFVNGEYAESAQAFQSVVELGEKSHFYQQALHKYGWNLLKLDRFDEALASFFVLLDIKFSPLELDADPFAPLPVVQADKELIDDTLYAVALVFSYINSVDRIEAQINKRGRKNYDHIIYQTLADFYLRQQRYQDVANIYTIYSVRYTKEPQAAFFKLKLIDVYTLAENPVAALNARKHFVKVYGPESSFWMGYSDKVHAQLMPPIKLALEDITQHYHAVAQREKGEADYNMAENWYRTYLRLLPESTDRIKIHYLLADMLYEGKRYAEASQEYERVAYEFTANPHQQEAGYAAILAYRELLKLAGHDKQAQWSEKQVATLLRYTERYPQDPRIAPLMTALAQESYSAKEYDKAQMLAQRVIALGDNIPAALIDTAWTINGHSDFEHAEYARAERSYQQLLKLAQQHGTVKPEMFEWLAASIYKQAKQKQSAGNLTAAVNDYLRIATVAPATEISIQAEYEAATLLIEMKEWQRAIATLEHFRNSYPNHELQQELPLKMALLYTESGKQLQAAEQYEQIAHANHSVDMKREAAWQAAELYEKEKQLDRSARAYEFYLQQFAEPYSQQIEARYRLSQLYLSLGQRARSDFMVSQLVADEKNHPGHTDRSRYLVAQAALTLADSKLEEFRSVKLVEPLAKNLITKKERMEEALSAYNQAATYRVADVVTASTYRIGEIYYQFSKNLMESERPKELGREELDEYNMMLEEQAFPFEEKAIAILESNTQRTSSGLYDSWVKKSYGKLKELLPIRYSKSEKGARIVESLE